jgi:hypothetical protein
MPCGERVLEGINIRKYGRNLTAPENSTHAPNMWKKGTEKIDHPA